MKYLILTIHFLLLCIVKITSETPIQNRIINLDEFNRANNLIAVQPDSAISIFKSLINSSEHENDTLVLQSCIQVLRTQSLNQNFADAFEYASQALRIAEHIRDTFSIAEVMGDIGLFYKHFGKEKESQDYLINSLALYKTMHKNDRYKNNHLSRAYFNLAMHYREFQKYDYALAYLDSCKLLSNTSSISNSYHKAERAAVLISKGKTKEAIQILDSIANLLENRLTDSTLFIGLKGFLTIIYEYTGDAYLENKDYPKALAYFNKAMINNEKYRLHNSNKSCILEKLAQSNFHLNHFREAYIQLKESKQIADLDWNAASKKNSSFFEISNKHKDKIEQQQLELLEQEKLLAQQKHRILLFQVSFILLISVLIIGLLLNRNKIQRKNFNREKQSLEEKRKSTRLELELKNKELTAYTLKFIEKEKVLADISDILKTKAKDDTEILSKLKAANANSGVLWEEFNSRFVEVNNGFYEKLKAQFPKLSPTELKHCALIKLNFSGKEMSHLLGITEHSVHVSRYRLRKKMNLEKQDNLNEFINEI